ncbi:MAG: menaquinone biosynthesis protein [Armatimonadetes bacterium]|nr:menaquinone biosynthesis protein [Armatimonadota bacterium]
MRFRIGAVPYLNVAPLILELESPTLTEYPPAPEIAEFILTKEVPSILSCQVAGGELDVASMPVVDYLSGVGACLVPDISIASLGKVASVVLFSKKPLEQVSSIGHDIASKSSVALLKVLLREKWNLETPVVSYSGPASDLMVRHEAGLLIGDTALTYAQQNEFRAFDLGEEWYELTGLPFVFAAWVLAQEAGMGPLVSLLQRAKAAGLRRLEEVVDRSVGVAGLDRAGVERYLTENINFDFDDRHLEGLVTFQKLCHKHGVLTGTQREVKFYRGGN